VVKPDVLIKRRGKSGLLLLNVEWSVAREWLSSHRGQSVTVDGVTGTVDHFIVEPFVPHAQAQEMYICLQTARDGDMLYFYTQGGVDVGDVDAKARKVLVPVQLDAAASGDAADEVAPEVRAAAAAAGAVLVPVPTAEALAEAFLAAGADGVAPAVSAAQRAHIGAFAAELLAIFRRLQFAYLEVNPLVVTDSGISVLDMAAKLDEAAYFECAKLWLHTPFPPPFGKGLSAEEQFVKDIDGKTGASLKLTVLNPDGRVWLMVAGGGASVAYADTVADLGFGHELANYGEYSGAPTTGQTYDYARTILSLLTARPHPRGEDKVLIIGGGIANFTDVAATFKGIIKALGEYAAKLIDMGVRVFVRRAGPNWQEGLRLMREQTAALGIDCSVYGPEMHMTSVVPLALGLKTVAECLSAGVGASDGAASGAQTPSGLGSMHRAQSAASLTGLAATAPAAAAAEAKAADADASAAASAAGGYRPLFTPTTQAIVYGLQLGAVQNMLDFDFICGRAEPSVACLVYPFNQNHYQKFYWNSKEILLPCLQSLDFALAKFPRVDTVVNFASFRSAYETSVEVLRAPQIRTLAIIAEGVPELRARQLLALARARGVTLIGPATVGGLKPGCFRIGNAGGMLDNLVASRLYRRGSVAYVTRSGGLSNEMNNICAHNSDGVYEGVAIGGDRFPGSTFVDHLRRYQADPDVKVMVLLGEVGGVEEYEVCRMLRDGELTKPLIAWCLGTCAKVFPYDVQFGHAGACAGAALETADAKNTALRAAGALVPETFDALGTALRDTYNALVREGVIKVKSEVAPPAIPVDYKWASKLGLVRKPAAFISTISDERGDELTYAGTRISTVLESDMGVGGVIGLLWFRRQLPRPFCDFLSMVLQLTADHGPAVSGAHNTIVAARAGKDLISSLCSGLLTVGPRFGGALDDAARRFSAAFDAGQSPNEFIEDMRRQKELIPGIGHKVKSLEDPDARVALIKKFVAERLQHAHPLFDYACEVEQLTTRKKSSLILNVDGAVAVVFVDLMRNCGAFTKEEADEYIQMGVLNGLFVIGRSVGFVGHWIDQNRLKQPLYRCDDVTYVSDDLTF
jgi:ATP citrate (pro-S)-lyase